MFLPLSRDDAHHFTSLRIPLTNEQREFDEQVLSLTKLLIDSLNEEEIKRALPPGALKGDERGIAKFACFLAEKGYDDAEGDVRFLRDLQELRWYGTAHRKGGNYDKVAARLGVQDRQMARGFERLLGRATRLLSNLGSQLIDGKDEPEVAKLGPTD